MGARARMSEVPIRVAIVDDHPALREGTAGLLARERDIDVVGVVGSLEEARTLIDGDAPPQVVILDIRLGGQRGLELLTGAHQARSGRPAIVVWTAYDVPQYVAFAFRSGAAGFVLKTAPTAELIAAIRLAASGGTYFAGRPDLGTASLTDRERDVLGLLLEGLSNDEMAGRIGVTTRTVEAHLTRLYERFGARSRAELAARAAREGWLDVPPGRVADGQA